MSQLCAAFVDCTRDKLLTVVWKCSEQKETMNKCLFKYTNPHELDRWKVEHLDEKRARMVAADKTNS